MTARTPAYLKTHFENGDIPVQTDYEDVFDSFLNIAAATSGEQQVFGPIKVPDLTATRVSATGGFFTSIQAAEFGTQTVSATNINGTTATFTNLSTTNATITSANVSNLQANTVSAAALNASIVSAANAYILSGEFLGALDVSAVGSTQAQATVLTAPLSFVIYADKGDYGVKLGASQRGLVQSVINASTTAINIFPAVSARFLVTAVNASLKIPADKCATVYHQGNDRYGIQIG